MHCILVGSTGYGPDSTLLYSIQLYSTLFYFAFVTCVVGSTSRLSERVDCMPSLVRRNLVKWLFARERFEIQYCQ